MKRDSVVKKVVGRREQKKAETAHRIAIAGRKLLRSKGFDALTTQEVALEAGIPPGTLFGYISSKTDLLILALIHEAMEFVGTIKLRVPTQGAFIDKVQFVFNEMASYHGRDLEVSRHFLRELTIVRNPDMASRGSGLGTALRDIVSAIVEKHQAAGEIDASIPPERISTFLFAHYWHYLRHWMSGNIEAQDFSPRLNEALHWQVMGLVARPGAPAPPSTAVKKKKSPF